MDDFVSLPDLAPTFLEVAGVEVPRTMTARSLVPVLASDAAGQVDPARDAVFTGRERHVARARTGFKPYPQRAIRTDQYLYIINFQPDRWPMGTGPGYGARRRGDAQLEALRENTFSAFGDMDASPTKAWVIMHRDADPQSFQYAVGRLPKYELYDIQADPHCLKNLAEAAASRGVRENLHQRLIKELKDTGDPRSPTTSSLRSRRSPMSLRDDAEKAINRVA